jgi:hypothetical protein
MIPAVDVSVVEAHLARARARRERGPLPWWLRRYLVCLLFVGLALAASAAMDGELDRMLDFSGLGVWKLAVILVFSLALAFWSGWTELRDARLGSEAVARRIETEWRNLAGPRWLRTTLLMGAKLGAGIGIPVGALLALAMPAAGLPSENRPLALLLFIAMTLAWTLPFAFLLRLVILRGYRRFAPRASSS